MPPFYVQQMASANHLPLNIATTVTGQIDVSATLSEDGKQLILHIVNPEEKPVPASINFVGFEKRKSAASIVQLTGKLKDVNTPAQPTLISPKSARISTTEDVINYTLPAVSYTIIRFNR
jgi:alpha-L-arabinofuranosidase